MCTLDAQTEMESETISQPRTTSKVQIGQVVEGVLYIMHRDYVRQEFDPAILVTESSFNLANVAIHRDMR